jgi:predicted permease
MGALSIVILLGKRLGNIQTGRSLRAAFFRIFGLIAWLVSIYGLYLINQLVIYLMAFNNYEAYDFLFPISYGLWISQPLNAKYTALSLFYFAVITLLFFFGVRELSKEEVASTTAA